MVDYIRLKFEPRRDQNRYDYIHHKEEMNRYDFENCSGEEILKVWCLYGNNLRENTDCVDILPNFQDKKINEK